MSNVTGGYVPDEDERIQCDEPGHTWDCPGRIGGDHTLIPADELGPEWFEDEEGFIREPLNWRGELNREGDPAFNGAFR